MGISIQVMYDLRIDEKVVPLNRITSTSLREFSSNRGCDHGMSIVSHYA